MYYRVNMDYLTMLYFYVFNILLLDSLFYHHYHYFQIFYYSINNKNLSTLIH